MGKKVKRSRVLSIAFAISLLVAATAVVQSAKAFELYWLDTNLKDDIPVYTPVTATAWTIDWFLTSVTFTWKDPNGNVVKVEKVNLAVYTTPNAPPNAPQSLLDWIAH
ncbi:MAG: hypothetical protein JTT11_03010, partial [Candidatus Brockarchaeota archaeon]|nr:hypothetical protein [Candidatus Brockarchaeota archaeon]